MLETAYSEAYGIQKTWEELVQALIFDKLDMSGAGFGPPAAPDELNQPWGHYGDPPEPVNPSGEDMAADNPVGFNSTGRIHLSLSDMEKYVRMLLDKGRPLLTSHSFGLLSTPFSTREDGVGYSLGLVCTGTPGKPDFLLGHDGATYFYMTMIVLPVRNSAVVIASNYSGDKVVKAIYSFRDKLLEDFINK